MEDSKDSKYWHYMEREYVSPLELDLLLADGWRHFGTFFFRDRMSWNERKLCQIIPLRIDLRRFNFTKSQRKVLRRNQDVRVIFRKAFIDYEKEDLFYKHCVRFTHNVPNSVYDFLSPQPDCIPCQTWECCLFDESGKLYAVSFFDVGLNATSSVYAMFDPAYAQRSPGLHTLLAEIIYAIERRKAYLYTGYAFREPSHYDYKKKFRATQFYDWQGNWANFENE
ncbi:MAG: arginine-tRNA-protein transferase [Bacteroidia bacterium]|nr:arginine-tRNA-protein transferase [Bacteroidia bacterium]